MGKVVRSISLECVSSSAMNTGRHELLIITMCSVDHNYLIVTRVYIWDALCRYHGFHGRQKQECYILSNKWFYDVSIDKTSLFARHWSVEGATEVNMWCHCVTSSFHHRFCIALLGDNSGCCWSLACSWQCTRVCELHNISSNLTDDELFISNRKRTVSCIQNMCELFSENINVFMISKLQVANQTTVCDE